MKNAHFLIVTMLIFCSAFNAQNNKTIDKKKRVVVDNGNLSTATVNKPASESLYYGYETKIIEFSISNAIPAGFPTNEGYKSKELYRNAINKWMKENEVFVKPDYKNKAITD